jgi:hypothetical protein
MCTILIVAAIVSVTCPAPLASSAEAARILAPHAYVAPATWPHGHVVVIPSSPTAGPFGEFPPPPPARPSCCDVYVHYHPRPFHGGRR